MKEVEFISSPIIGNELLIGCGHEKQKKMSTTGKQEWTDLVTLDMTSDVKPDVLWDLNHLPLPFNDETFEEIHAYDVLEHVGQQGDFKTFFKQFDEFHRILKPGGHFYGITPMWDCLWAWGDPGHTRVITAGTLTFLDRSQYDKGNNMTDYRSFFSSDWEIVHAQELDERFTFVLKKR